MNPEILRELARGVLEIEAEAIRALIPRIDAHFIQACQLILACRGRVVVSGMGKSGHIARKIAATLASTGTPAFYMHPADAYHGDMGTLTGDDVVLVISNSGHTEEITRLLPQIKRLGASLVALTGRRDSLLAQEADVHLDVSVAKEACPLGLAPTASTTAALAMGDALAVALLESRGFTREDFARSHPGGQLGKRLLLRIRDIMHSGADVPQISAEAMVSAAIVEISRKRLGLCAVVDADQRVLGVFTDGDLRRALDSDHNPRQTPVGAVMTRDAKTIHQDALAAEAVELMQRYKIQGLLVVDQQAHLVGALNFHDLLQSGVV